MAKTNSKMSDRFNHFFKHYFEIAINLDEEEILFIGLVQTIIKELQAAFNH